MAKWSRVSEEMSCNKSFRANSSTELEVLLRFLNQIKTLSETDHLLGLNKQVYQCLNKTRLWKIQWVLYTRTHTYRPSISRDNWKCNWNSFTDILEYNTNIVFDFESSVSVKSCNLDTFYFVHHPSAFFLLYISCVILGIIINQTKYLFYAILSTLWLGTAQQCTGN